MSLSITCIKNERGPALKVVYFVKCNGHGNFEAKKGPLIIGHLFVGASIKFKFSCVNMNPNQIDRAAIIPPPKFTKFTVWTSVQDSLCVKPVEVNVTCKQLNFSKQLCSYDEEHDVWQLIGSIESEKPEYCFELTMILSRTEEIFTFAEFYEDTELTDFLLRSADGSTVAVHKICLAAHSDVFKKMLLSKFKETTEGCIEFKDVTLQTLKHLKNYIYLGTLPDIGVEPLLLIAKCYMMTNLFEDAINKICQTATAGNLYSLLQLATENNIPELALGLLQMANDEAVNNIVIKEQKLQSIGKP